MINKIKNISITVLLIFVVVSVAGYFIKIAKIKALERKEQKRKLEIVEVNKEIENERATNLKKREAYQVEIKEALRLAQEARSLNDNTRTLTKKEIKNLRTKNQSIQVKYDILEIDNFNKQDKINLFIVEVDEFKIAINKKDGIISSMEKELSGLYGVKIPKLNKIIADQGKDISKFISDRKKTEIVFGPQGGYTFTGSPYLGVGFTVKVFSLKLKLPF